MAVKRFQGDPETIGRILAARIAKKFSRFQTSDKDFRTAMLRVATLIEAQAVLNIRTKLNRNSKGALRASIGHRFESRNTLLVGSFGIPYARIHEFGGTITPKTARKLAIPINKEFEGRRARDVPGLFRGKGRSNDILFKKNADGSIMAAFVLKDSVTIPPRPYLAPAIRSTRQRAIGIMANVIGKKLGGN